MKILIIQQKMIGDVLTTSILFEAIKQKHPQSELHYVINTHTYPVVEHNPYIDYFHFFTPQHQKSKRKLWAFAMALRKERFDVVIDIYAKLSSNLITICSGAKTRISIHKKYTKFIYNYSIKNHFDSHEGGRAAESRLKLLQPLNIHNIINIYPKIYLTSQEIQSAKIYLENNNIKINQPIIMVNVLGSSPNKTYPIEQLIALINFVCNNTNAQILFNYEPNQHSKALEIKKLCNTESQRQIHFEVYGKNLRSFMAITHFCICLIGNEGGSTNMAKALDIPTFTIYAPWINKTSWNFKEDGKSHVSVHLKDYKPKLFNNTKKSHLKQNALELYEHFKFEFFKTLLEKYLQNITSTYTLS